MNEYKSYKVVVSQNGINHNVIYRTKRTNTDLGNAAQKCYEHFDICPEDGEICVSFYHNETEIFTIFFEE